jgi:hypothetical protein
MNASLEERVAVLERLSSSAYSTILSEIQRLSENDSVLGEALETHDNLLLTLRSLLAQGPIYSEQQIESRLKEVIEMRARAAAEAAKQRELQAISRRAEEAAKESAGHPKEAFVFGG